MISKEQPGNHSAGELKLTVVCPTYNHAKYIRRALDGFVRQKTSFKFEVIVGDDASTDETPAIIEEYATKYPNIIKSVLRAKNLGSAENFQDLIKTIDTEYVALCEGDDYWIDNYKLQKQIEFLDQNRDFAICFHPVVVKYDNSEKSDDINPSQTPGIFSPHPFASPYDHATLSIRDIAIHSCIPTCSIVYRWRFRKGKDLELFPCDVNPRDVLNNLLHAETGKVYFMQEVMGCYFRPTQSLWSQANLLERNALPIIRFYEFIESHFSAEITLLLSEERNIILHNMLNALLREKRFDIIDEIAAKHEKIYSLIMSLLQQPQQREFEHQTMILKLKNKRREQKIAWFVAFLLFILLIISMLM